jgi:hypothetical protein
LVIVAVWLPDAALIVTEPKSSEVGENATPGAGFGVTCSTALAAAVFVAAVVPIVALTAPAPSVFVYAPASSALTGMLTAQPPLACSVPPASTSAPPPLAVPPQPFVAAPLLVSPAGNVSVNPTAVSGSPFGFASVTVKVEDVPAVTDPGVNSLLTVMTGVPADSDADTAAARVALPPATVPDKLAGAIVFVKVPAAFSVTATEVVHDPLAGTVSPPALKALLPAIAVSVPAPQLVVAFGVAAFTIPAG